MTAIERFEDVAAWQGARELVKAIYGLTGQGPFARDFGLRDQIRTVAVSIMPNVAEGFERGSDKEFRHFLLIAKASAGEVRSLLYVALDLHYVEPSSYQTLHEQVTKVSRQIAGFIRYLGGESPRKIGDALVPYDL